MFTETEHYRGFEIEIHIEECPENPWEAWDCEPPIVVYHGGHGSTAYKGYGVYTVLPYITEEMVREHLDTLCELAETTPAALFEEVLDNPGLTVADVINEGIDDTHKGEAMFDALTTLWELTGVTAVASSISGHCQRDWGHVLAVATPEWIRRVGAPEDPEQLTKQLEGAIQLYEWYTYGDVYWYSVEGEDGESLDSCSGFYGPDHEKSGLLEMARDAIDGEIERRRKARLEQVKAWVRHRVPLEQRGVAA